MKKTDFLRLTGSILCALYSVTVTAASCWLHYQTAEEETSSTDRELVLTAPAQGDYPLGLLMADSAAQTPHNEENPSPSSDLYAVDETSGILPLSLHSDDLFALSNETDYTPDLPNLLRQPLEKQAAAAFMNTAAGEQPLVLVLHTHGTESYALEGITSYPENYGFRTSDTTQNVVAVGEIFAQTLEDRGISALHCTTMHDEESYIYAYTNAAETIRAYLDKYPSIKYVIDLHRDALERQDGTILRPVVSSPDGTPTAQIMLVVGTDARGGSHPDWQTNLSLAVKLQQALEDTCPTVTRPINLRGATFNQQYTPGSLLVEIGSTGNTLTEAKEAAVIAANALADIITKD